MKLKELKTLENNLNHNLPAKEKIKTCLILAEEYAMRFSTKLIDIIDLGLSIPSISPEDKYHLLLLKLNKTFNDPSTNFSIYKELSDLIKNYHLGADKYDRIFINQGILLFKNRNYTESIDFFKTLLKENFEKKELSEYAKESKGKIFYYLAWCEMLMGNAEKSLIYFEKQKSIALEKNNHRKVASIIDNIANLYANDKDYVKAETFMNESLEYFKKFDNLEYSVKTYIHLAGNFMNQGKLNKAIEYYNLTLNLAQQNNDLINQIFSWNNLSRIAVMQDDLDTFFEIRAKLLEHIDFILKDRIVAVSFCRQSIEGFMKQGDYTEALKWADKFESYQTNSENVVDLDRIYNLKIELYKALKNKDKEIEYLNKFLDLKDKILKRAKKKALEEYEAKYQNDLKEREIQNLKLESVSLQLQFLRSQMNPHFVFNTIASITSNINPNTLEQAKKLLNHFARLMRANLDFSELDTISLEEEILFLNDYLALEKNRLGNKMEYEINYSNSLDVDFIDVPSMLLQPHIENAIKHGISSLKTRVGKIIISFKLLNDHCLLCSIKDNGIGREKAQKIKQKMSKYQSKSTKITESRLNLINLSNEEEVVNVEYKDLKNDQNEAIGTEVFIKIKI